MPVQTPRHQTDNKPEQKTPDHSKAKQRQARRKNLEKTSPKRTAKPTPNNTTPGLQDLTAKIKSRITTSNHRLTTMMTPIRNPEEGAAREDEINRVCSMANKIKSSLLDIKTYHKNTLDVLELGNFRSLLDNIESRTSTAHRKLMAWKKTKHMRPNHPRSQR